MYDENMSNGQNAENEQSTENGQNKNQNLANPEPQNSESVKEETNQAADSAQPDENHQYRYGRSFYQNHQDSIYHTNESSYQNDTQYNSGAGHSEAQYTNGMNQNPYNNGTNQNDAQYTNGMNQNDTRSSTYTQTNNSAQNNSMNSNGTYTGANQSQGQQSYQTYSAGQSVQGSSRPPKQKKSGSRVAVKVVKAAACLVIVAAVGAGSAVGTSYVWNRYHESDSKTETKKVVENTTVPVSTVSSKTAVVTDVSEVVEQTMPSVVKITNVGTQSYSGFFGQGGTYEYESNGSGIIIGQTDEELLVATNQHVVSGADTLKVIFIDEESCEANVKGTDAQKDLAVIAIPISSIKEETLKQIKVATLGDSNALHVGEPAIAIGNALGYGQSVTCGVISAKDREVTTESYTNKLIQTDAAINPGNSGGALLNMAGEVIGINSVKYSSTEVEGMGYAIPISDATPIINELMNKETKSKVDEADRSYMGISGVDITSDVAQTYNMPKGVYVAQVVKDGPAQKAGIKKGDIITKIGDVSVTSFDELKAELEYHAAGTTVKVEILTQAKDSYGYESKSVDVTLSKKED